MNQSHSTVVKIIKDYVNKCGGDVTVPALMEDYSQAFGCDVPYLKLGHNSLVDFLMSIAGLLVSISGGEYHVRTRHWTSAAPSQSAHSQMPTDLSSLCIEMKNNLIVSDSNAKRKVTLKEGNRLRYPRNAAQRYISPNVRSDKYSPSSGYGSDNHSTANSSFDYSPGYPTRDDYFAYEPDEYSFTDPDVSNATDYDWHDSQWQQPYHQFASCDLPAQFESYDTPAQSASYSPAPSASYSPAPPASYSPAQHASYSSAQHASHSSAQPASYSATKPASYSPAQSASYDSPLLYGSASAEPTLRSERRDAFRRPLSPVNYNDLFPPDRPAKSDPDLPHHPTPVSDKQIVNRLVALVNAHQKKILSSAVEYQYVDSYSDALPKNWLTLLEESQMLFVERLAAGVTIYPNRTLPAIPTLLDLPKLDMPLRMPWSVNVTVIRSVHSVWFRLNENDLDHRYQLLGQQMRKHYQNVLPAQVLSVEAQQLFVAKFKNGLLRVCVLERLENGACRCLAIDEGITEVFPLTSLMMLHEKFTNTPKLILQGSLVGLGKYAECSHVRDRLEKMVVSVDASVVVEKCEGAKMWINLFVAKADSSVNVNEYLSDVIKKELNLPKLKVDGIFDVVVLSLSIDDNVAKVQIKSPCLELLQESLRKCGHIIDCTDRRLLFARNMIDVQLNQLYLAKYTDGSWQRVLLKQFINSTHVVVVFVDFQDIQALEITKIICYANFPDAITFIPPQGVTVNIVKNDREVLKLMYLKLKTNLFSMKIVQTDPKLYVQMYMKAPDETCDKDFSDGDFKQFRSSAV